MVDFKLGRCLSWVGRVVLFLFFGATFDVTRFDNPEDEDDDDAAKDTQKNFMVKIPSWKHILVAKLQDYQE